MWKIINIGLFIIHGARRTVGERVEYVIDVHLPFTLEKIYEIHIRISGPLGYFRYQFMFQVYGHGPFRSCARDLVVARLTMHHGIVLGDASKKPVPPNSPVMSSQAQLGNGEYTV